MQTNVPGGRTVPSESVSGWRTLRLKDTVEQLVLETEQQKARECEGKVRCYLHEPG